MVNTITNNYDLSKEESDNISILKLLLSIFLVYLHTSNSFFDINSTNYLSSFSSFICSSVLFKCASGGFFIISSILLYRKTFIWKDNLKKKFKTLLIPYLLMNIITILIYMVAFSIPFIRNIIDNPNKNVFEFNFLQWLKAFGLFSSTPIYSTMWFLRNLFVLNILSLLIKKMIDSFPKLSIFLLLINCAFNKFTFFDMLYPETLMCWCFGYYVVKYNIRLPKLEYIKVTVFYFLVIVINCFLFFYNVSIPESLIILRNVFNVVCGFTFWIYSVDYLSIRIKSFILEYSKYSFPIYLFHLYLVKVFSIIITKYISSYFVLFLLFLVIPLIIVFMIIIVWNKICSKNIKIISLISGGR